MKQIISGEPAGLGGSGYIRQCMEETVVISGSAWKKCGYIRQCMEETLVFIRQCMEEIVVISGSAWKKLWLYETVHGGRRAVATLPACGAPWFGACCGTCQATRAGLWMPVTLRLTWALGLHTSKRLWCTRYFLQYAGWSGSARSTCTFLAALPTDVCVCVFLVDCRQAEGED